MAPKKYTVTLPEELAEEIREKVGPEGFSAYVTEAVKRHWHRERLGELVEWLEEEYGPVSEAELAAAEEQRREWECEAAERARAAAGVSQAPGRRWRPPPRVSPAAPAAPSAPASSAANERT